MFALAQAVTVSPYFCKGACVVFRFFFSLFDWNCEENGNLPMSCSADVTWCRIIWATLVCCFGGFKYFVLL